MVVYSAQEFKSINENSKFYKILNKDLKTGEGIQLSLGMNVHKAYLETSSKYGLQYVTTPLVFMGGEFVLDFLGSHDYLEDPTVFEVEIPDDATVFTEDFYINCGLEEIKKEETKGERRRDNAKEYYPLKYITDKLIINYRLNDSDFLYLFKNEGWIYDYHKKQEDEICRFFVRSGFFESLRYVKSGEALRKNVDDGVISKPIIYSWNVSVSQEAARSGNLQLLEEICSIDIYGKKEVCQIDTFAVHAFRRRRKKSSSQEEDLKEEDLKEGEKLIFSLIEKQEKAGIGCRKFAHLY